MDRKKNILQNICHLHFPLNKNHKIFSLRNFSFHCEIKSTNRNLHNKLKMTVGKINTGAGHTKYYNFLFGTHQYVYVCVFSDFPSEQKLFRMPGMGREMVFHQYAHECDSPICI